MKKFLLLVFLSLTSITFAACSSENTNKAASVDVDLTTLSGIMVYSEVYNMMTNPDDYLGKTIKLNGPYAVSYYEGKYYHFVLVEGVDACCPEGLEFRLGGNHVYPDDYPPENAIIEFVGVFSSHEDFEIPYYYLAVDDLFF